MEFRTKNSFHHMPNMSTWSLLCIEKVNKEINPQNLPESALPLLDVLHKNSSQTWGAHSNPTSFYVNAPQDYQISSGEGHHHLLHQI